MALVTQLGSCDGFTVESADGCLGWVEETWLDEAGHPAALALRTGDGRRALLLADAVQAVDPDAQEVFVARGTVLRGLEPPRLQTLDGDPAASWRAFGSVEAFATAPAHALPGAPALAAARAGTTTSARPLWQIVAFAFSCLVLLVGVEIALAFGVTYLVTGSPPY
jgi:hypothetical protein